MKFSAREDVEAPIEEVFAVVTDFDKIERAAMRRGAEVTRTDALEAPGPGMVWIAEFDMRGKRRRLETRLADYSPPEALVVHSEISGLAGISTVELVRLTPRQTRIAVAVDLRPQTMSARIFLQTLRLAKSRMSDRFKAGVTRFAREIEAGTFR